MQSGDESKKLIWGSIRRAEPYNGVFMSMRCDGSATVELSSEPEEDNDQENHDDQQYSRYLYSADEKVIDQRLTL